MIVSVELTDIGYNVIADLRLKQCHALVEREEFDRAWPYASAMLNDNPDNAKALYFAGMIMRAKGDVGIALNVFRRALALEPKVPNLWMHYGACLHDTHQYEMAREAFHAVLKMLPNDPVPMANIAAAYIQEGKANDAIKWADKALSIEPRHAGANISKAFACLALGRWEEGWKHQASLYGDHLRIRVYNPPEKEEPMWDGAKGQTVVVQADQGLGDMIMFSQCLPQLLADCKQVIVDCDPKLAPLFRRNFPGLTVYDTLHERSGVQWPKQYAIDAHIHISWLGKFYRKSDAEFPRTVYLRPEESLLAKWQTYLADYPRPWVGLAWQGGIHQTNAASRSMALAELAPVINSGGTVFSLAYQEVGREIATWNINNRAQIHAPVLDDDDYEDTLAFLAALDHVVTVTTTVAHVCGALGKKAYVLVNQIPAWRYQASGDSMAWYPENSVRLYRQKPGEMGWQHAIARLTRDYQTFVLPLAA